jgi:4-amino-4-deoxy-L-arabinose transferase-like glycosyltransferase
MNVSIRPKDRTASFYVRTAWLVLAAALVLRVLVASQIELVGDEAYYWRWSNHLDWSYYSKGPGVAIAIFLGTGLLGDSELGVRLATLLVGFGTGWGIFTLGRRLFTARVGFWSMVAGAVAPLFLAGGLLMTIDPLSVFFWILASLFFWRARSNDRIADWLLTGLWIGIGFLCKYTNMALLACFTLFLLWNRADRRHFRRPGFYLMIAVALLGFTPVLIWNAQHDWITFRHLMERGQFDEPFRVRPLAFLEFLSLQIALFYPPFAVGLIVAFVRMRKTLFEEFGPQTRFLLSLILPLFLFYATLALNDPGEGNWTSQTYPAALILLSASWNLMIQRTHRGTKAATWSLSIGAALAAAVYLMLFLPLPFLDHPFRRIRGMEDLAADVRQRAEESGAEFIIVPDYGRASRLHFYLRGHPPVFMTTNEDPGRIRNQYDFWPGYADRFQGGDALLLLTARENPESHVPPILRREFETIEPAGKLSARHDDQIIRTFHTFDCRSFTPLPRRKETP